MSYALRRLYPTRGDWFTTVEREFAMKSKFALVLVMYLMSLPVLADEAVVAAVPKGDTDPTALIVSAVLFFGMIIWFFVHVFRKGDSGKKE